MTNVFDIFTPGVGPSSSHTMGPMTAGLRFVRDLAAAGQLRRVGRVQVELLGALAATGAGHRTDAAIQLGLAGFDPATVDADTVDELLRLMRVMHPPDVRTMTDPDFTYYC